jgi:hypothetical protein
VNQWMVVIPLEAIKKSEPEVNIFIEPGNALNGISVPETEPTDHDPRIEFTCNGEQYDCERWDLENCARPRS